MNILVVLLCASLFVRTQAQDNTYDRTPIASPTAAGLGKYVDFPVNKHTGIPEINIDIYKIEAGNLKVPISISNHPSGLRVLEPSSWVGAGFSLNAGGMITRTVRGAPDERLTSTIFNQDKGFFSDTGYMRSFYNGLLQDWQGVAAGRLDAEPDLYFFNFNGYSGKFFFSDDRRPIILADGKSQDIQIEANYNGSGSIYNFKLTTPDGTVYWFGGAGLTSENTEISNPFNGVGGYQQGQVISTWYLTKMINADRSQTIDFSYASENYSYYSIMSTPILSTDNSNPLDAKLFKNYLQGKRLSRIDFNNGSVTFKAGAVRTDLGGFTIKEMADTYVNTEATALGSIEISNKTGFCKKYTLYTSYWQDNTTPLPTQLANFTINTDKKRLRLDSIKESTCAGTLVQPAMKFEYYAEAVPRRLTFAQDHWGYFNGQTGNTKLTPTIMETGTGSIPGADRSPGWPYMRAGTLKRLYWPTGGSTDYDFEAHSVTLATGTPTYETKKTLVIGYDGSNPMVKTDTITLTGGQYKITLLNTTGGGFASFSMLHNATGTYPVYLTANNGGIPTEPVERYVPAGLYTITITKDAYENGATSGNGATAIIDQYTGTTGPLEAMVGGLRIKSITVHDHLSNSDNLTAYGYNTSNRSNGILYSRPVYAALVRNDLIALLGDWTPAGFVASCSPAGCIACTGFPYFKSANSIQPMSTTQGEHVGYSEVVVGKADGAFSIYRYYTGLPTGYLTPSLAVTAVDRSVCSGSVSSYPYTPEPHNYLRGKLQEEMHFRPDGKILKDVLYTYEYQTPADSTRAFMAATLGSRILGAFYWLTRSKKLKEVQYQTVYAEDSQEYVSTEQSVYFGSSYHELPTRETYYDSKSDSVVTLTKYVKDFEPACAAIFTCDNSYRNACNSCQTTYVTAQNACSGQGSACYTNAYLNYLKCVDNARIDYSDCKLDKQHGLLSEYYFCKQFYRATADSNLKAIYQLSASNSNERVEEVTFKAGKLVKARINLHKRNTDSIRVYPYEMRVIPISDPGAAHTPASISGNSLLFDSRYQAESGVQFDSGTVRQLSPAYEVPISTIWDFRNSYRTAVATNAALTEIAYTSFEGENKGGWSFVGTPTVNANAPTGDKVFQPSGTTAINRLGLNSGETYILSYWTDRSTPFSVGGTQGGARKGSTTPGGWTYYEHTITGVSAISLNSSGLVDELRLYPKRAQMVTYTYTPMVGMTSMCNTGGDITRYSYDELGRLVAVRDRDGNLLKLVDYQFQSPITQ